MDMDTFVSDNCLTESVEGLLLVGVEFIQRHFCISFVCLYHGGAKLLCRKPPVTPEKIQKAPYFHKNFTGSCQSKMV